MNDILPSISYNDDKRDIFDAYAKIKCKFFKRAIKLIQDNYGKVLFCPECELPRR